MAQHKRGDTYDIVANIPTSFVDGYFNGWEVVSQIRNKAGKLIANLDCSWIDDTTRILSVKALDTSAWSIGPAEMDIQFTRLSDGYTMSTATVLLDIIKDVTRATDL